MQLQSVDEQKTNFTTGESDFSHYIKCSVCNRLFSDRDSLVQHMRSHSRQTRFQCSVCGKDFAWRRHLTRHMQAHTNGEIDGLCDRDDDGNCQEFSTREQHLPRPTDVWENIGFSEQNYLSCHHFVYQSSQIHPSQREESNQENEQINREGFDGPEPAGLSKPDPDLQPKVEDQAAESSDPDTDDSDFWKETRKCKSNLISAKHGDVFQTDAKTNIHQFQSGEDPPEHKMQKEIKQEDTKSPQVKKEQEEIEILKLASSPGPVKFEEDERNPWAFWLYSSSKEDNIDSVGGQTTAKNSESGSGADYLINDGSVDCDFWMETKKPQSNLNSDSCINPLSVSGGVVESLQTGSDDSMDSDFWNTTRKPPPCLSAKDTEESEKVQRNEKKLKPYSCSDCGKRFAQSCHMKTHMKQHAEKRPYSCSVCGQEYPFRSQWEIHMIAHTGEKPFQCPVCGRKYSYKANMKAHMVMAHTEKKYNCDVCLKSFAWYTELKYHQCIGETSHQ